MGWRFFRIRLGNGENPAGSSCGYILGYSPAAVKAAPPTCEGGQFCGYSSGPGIFRMRRELLQVRTRRAVRQRRSGRIQGHWNRASFRGAGQSLQTEPYIADSPI